MSDAPRHDVPKGGRSGFAVVDGRQVHYLEWGHRGLPPVVCLHGGGQTAYMYEGLGATLAARAHVLAPDLPGHGDSDRLASEQWSPADRGTGSALTEVGISMPKAIAASLTPLCAEFGMDRVVLVGASLGGMSSLVYAAAHPDRVAGIVLVDVSHKLEPEGVRKIVDFMSAHESFASLEEAAGFIAEYLPNRGTVRVESLSRNLRQRNDGRWEWKHGVGSRLREAREAGVDLPHPADDLGSVLDGIEDAAASVQCPVLVLRGRQSDVLSDEGADELVQIIPNATLEVVEKAGHLAVGDNPHSTNALVGAFLDRIAWTA